MLSEFLTAFGDFHHFKFIFMFTICSFVCHNFIANPRSYKKQLFLQAPLFVLFLTIYFRVYNELFQ